MVQFIRIIPKKLTMINKNGIIFKMYKQSLFLLHFTLFSYIPYHFDYIYYITVVLLCVLIFTLYVHSCRLTNFTIFVLCFTPFLLHLFFTIVVLCFTGFTLCFHSYKLTKYIVRVTFISSLNLICGNAD